MIMKWTVIFRVGDCADFMIVRDYRLGIGWSKCLNFI